MKCKIDTENFAKKIGFEKINEFPEHFTPTFVLAVANGHSITVSEMLKQIEYAIRFIKANFDVDQKKYSETLKFLKLCELRFQNHSSSKPKKNMLHFAVEVFHEIQDMHAKDEKTKKENENISLFLDILIDMF